MVNASDNIDEVSRMKKKLYVCAYGATPPAPAGSLNSDSEVGDEDHGEAENQKSLRKAGVPLALFVFLTDVLLIYGKSSANSSVSGISYANSLMH